MSGRGPTVAVFDGDAPPTLAFVRALGRAGVPVTVYSHGRVPAARLSRFCARFDLCPDPADFASFLPWLRARLRSGEIELVAPTSDLIAFALTEVDDACSEPLRRVLPDPAAALGVLFKDRFADACARHGVRAARSFSPLGVEEAVERSSTLRFPLILKPKSHVGGGPERGVVVEDVDALRAALRPYGAAAGQHVVFEQNPGWCWPIVQEYIPRALENLFSVAGLIAPDGAVLGLSGSWKRSQWPPRLGVGTVFESIDDPALLVRGGEIARALLGRGLFELELIRDVRDGEYVAIDLNPRGYGQMSFEIARGLDLPRLWYACATGQDTGPAPATSRADELVWIHGIPFHIGQLVGIAKGPGRVARAREYVRRLAGRRVGIVADWRDPLPGLAYAFKMFRHPGGLVRPFLQES
jgi:D-aspartate ligase